MDKCPSLPPSTGAVLMGTVPRLNPGCPEQSPTMRHSQLALPPSLSHSPHPSLLLPRVTSQTHLLCQNPHLRRCPWRNPESDNCRALGCWEDGETRFQRGAGTTHQNSDKPWAVPTCEALEKKEDGVSRKKGIHFRKA